MTARSSPAPSPNQNAILVDCDGVEDASEVPLLQSYGVQGGNKDVEAQREQQDEGGAGFVETCFNGLNAFTGVGILSIPYALSQGGWLSLMLLFMVAVICYYTGLLLKQCMDADPSIRSYPDIGQFAFGRNGRLIVSICMYLELYLVAIEFLILEGDSLDKLFPNVGFGLGNLRISGRQFFVVIMALVVLPTTWLRSIGNLAFISAGGVLASLIVVGSVFWAATVDGVGFHERGRFLNTSGLPTSLGLYAFCYCGHAVLPTLYSTMKKKAQFSKVLFVCFFLSTLSYGSMAIFGYLMYGDDVQSQVTLNLPLGRTSSTVAIYTTLVNPVTKFALTITPVATAIEERLQAYNMKSVSLLIRSLLVSSIAIMALTIPFFAYLMAFIGSLLSVIVSVLLPCVCNLMIYKDSRRNRVELVSIAGILVLGVSMATLGTYSSVKQIIQEL